MHRQETRQPLTHSLTLTHGQTDFYSFTCLPTRLSSPLLYLPPQWPSPVTQTSYLQPLRPICLHSAPTVNQRQAASTLWQSIIGQKHQTTTSGINTDINNKWSSTWWPDATFDKLTNVFKVKELISGLYTLHFTEANDVSLKFWF